MKKYLIVFLFCLSVPNLYSQNFRLNAGGSFSHFGNIYNREVSFYGFGINYTYYFYKRAGLYMGFDHYFPTTYYGLSYVYEGPGIPVYITGGANNLNLGLRLKVIDPDSKRIEINATAAISSFIHAGSYHIEEARVDEIINHVNSFYAGMELILKKLSLPVAFSGGYNFVLNQEEGYKEWDGFSVPFSSSFVVRAAISLPVMKGPAPSQIKKIEY